MKTSIVILLFCLTSSQINLESKIRSIIDNSDIYTELFSNKVEIKGFKKNLVVFCSKTEYDKVIFDLKSTFKGSDYIINKKKGYIEIKNHYRICNLYFNERKLIYKIENIKMTKIPGSPR